MQPRRMARIEHDRSDTCEHVIPVAATETMRSATSMSKPVEGKPNEERISIFWRIFGGTILSIAALVVITAYQNHSTALHELRLELSHANEARAELVKKDEYAASRTKVWDRLQELQKDLVQIDQVKTRVATVEENSRSAHAERKEMHELHATIKERLLQFEQQLASGKMTQKDVQVLQQSIAALQEKSSLRDQQLKQADEERKELCKEVQALRERLAKIEALKEPAVTGKVTSKSGH